MDENNLARAIEIAKELERRKATNRMEEYDPYDYQKKFHASKYDVILSRRFSTVSLETRAFNRSINKGSASGEGCFASTI